MSNYFKDFPKILYLFGNEISPTAIQNLSKSTNLINQIADEISAYIEYEIKDFERPDTLSYNLYGTSEYDWTFFLMNDNLKERGWPRTLQSLYEAAEKDYYPDWTCKIDFAFDTVDSAASWSIDTTDPTNTIQLYTAGQKVELGGKPMIVKGKNLQVGEITLYSPYAKADRDSDFSTAGAINYPDGTYGKLLESVKKEMFGTYEYRNDSGNPIDLYFGEWNEATQTYNQPVTKIQFTNLDHLLEQNDELKRIRIIKNELIASVAGKYKANLG